MKIGVADFGMNVWDGACLDSEERWRRLKSIGFEGVERLSVHTADEAVARAALLRKLGMEFATIRGPSPELSIQWTAAFGKGYVWTISDANDFETFCRQANLQAEACERWGIRAALHNHMGTVVETQEQLERFMDRCPSCGLVFDTAHLAAAGGDPVEIAGKYADRLEVIHCKDWISLKPDEPVWYHRGRFCCLGDGNIGMDHAEILRAAVNAGYDGWIFVEHDTHLQNPFEDLKRSREFLRAAGY